MFVLAEFNVLRPEPGLFFWSVLFFLIFWFMIAKFAFKPIANALIIRENHIQDALLDASKAKEELRKIQDENTRMMEEARAQRAQIMKEAKNQSNKMVEDAKETAREEATKLLAQANVEIENQKKAALLDVKNQVTALALEVSERVIQRNLSNDKEQVRLISELVDDMHLS